MQTYVNLRVVCIKCDVDVVRKWLHMVNRPDNKYATQLISKITLIFANWSFGKLTRNSSIQCTVHKNIVRHNWLINEFKKTVVVQFTMWFRCNQCAKMNFLPDPLHCVTKCVLKSIKVRIILRCRYNYLQQPSIQCICKSNTKHK